MFRLSYSVRITQLDSPCAHKRDEVRRVSLHVPRPLRDHVQLRKQRERLERVGRHPDRVENERPSVRTNSPGAGGKL